MTWNILTFQKEKRTISWKQNLFLKKVIFSSNCTPFCMKNAPDPSKSCIASKKCHMREENQQTTQTISKHKWTNALGFELQSASNLHRDKKNTSFEPQSAPNLHRDKKTKVLNFKVHQTCRGTKKQKIFRGIVASSQVDCKVFVFFVIFVPVQVWCTLKFESLFVFVNVQVWCTLKFKPTVCLVPVEVWCDSWFAIKMYYSAGYWNCLFKQDVFSLFALVFSDSGV